MINTIIKSGINFSSSIKEPIKEIYTSPIGCFTNNTKLTLDEIKYNETKEKKEFNLGLIIFLGILLAFFFISFIFFIYIIYMYKKINKEIKEKKENFETQKITKDIFDKDIDKLESRKEISCACILFDLGLSLFLFLIFYLVYGLKYGFSFINQKQKFLRQLVLSNQKMESQYLLDADFVKEISDSDSYYLSYICNFLILVYFSSFILGFLILFILVRIHNFLEETEKKEYDDYSTNPLNKLGESLSKTSDEYLAEFKKKGDSYLENIKKNRNIRFLFALYFSLIPMIIAIIFLGLLFCLNEKMKCEKYKEINAIQIMQEK